MMNFWSVGNSSIAVAMLFLATGCDGTGAVAQQGGGQGRPPAEVGVVTLQPQSVDVTTELPGRITAARLAEEERLEQERFDRESGGDEGIEDGNS